MSPTSRIERSPNNSTNYNVSTTTFSNLDQEIQDANQRCATWLKVSTNTSLGWAVIADRDFAMGDLVMRAKSIAVRTVRDSHSVQTGLHTHATIDLPARFINHSCDPNVGILDNDLGAFDFFALKEIKKGQELLWDYETSEWEISAFSSCLCGASSCRKVLRGFKVDADSVRQVNGQYYAQYLKDMEKDKVDK